MTNQPSTQPLNPGLHNGAPFVDAGQNQNATLGGPGVVALSATVSDDGLPSGDLSVIWTAVGPAYVKFGDHTALVTTAMFSEPGEYHLVVTASDGALSAEGSIRGSQVTARPFPPA